MEKELDASVHRKRSWVATIITLLVLGFLGLFVSRVLYFADQIRSGGVDPDSLNFTSNLTVSAALASSPINDGVYDLTTTDDPSLGRADALVTIVEFADFGCPFSADESFVLRELMKRYPEQVRFMYRDFPLTDLHPLAQKAAQAGECAQDQGKFWDYHDKLYQNQNSLSEENFLEFAQALNFNMGQFEQCLNSGRYADEVIDDYQDGVEAGVYGTPTFFINGNRIGGAIPADVLDAVVQSIVNRQ